jgi:hypothetical protein
LTYPKEADCVYIVSTNLGSGINLFIPDFKLDERHPTNPTICQGSWIQIFEGSQINGPPITQRLCGSEAENQHYKSDSSTIAIWFHSDSDVGTGWDIEFKNYRRLPIWSFSFLKDIFYDAGSLGATVSHLSDDKFGDWETSKTKNEN